MSVAILSFLPKKKKSFQVWNYPCYVPTLFNLDTNSCKFGHRMNKYLTTHMNGNAIAGDPPGHDDSSVNSRVQ